MATSRPPRLPRRAFLLALLVAPLLSTTGLLAPAPATLADPLSDARARQQDLQRQIQEQQARVAQLASLESSVGAQVTATRASLDGVNADLAATKAQVTAIARSIAEAEATYDGLVVKIASLDTQLVEVQGQEARKADELAARKAQLADRVRDAYEADRTSMLEIILSSDTFTDFLAEAGYQMDMAGRDRDLAEQVRQDQAVLAELHQTVETTRDQTDQLRLATAAQKAALDARMVDLRAAQQRLQALEAETQRLLAQQQAAYDAAHQDKAAAQQELADQAAAQRALKSQIDQLAAQQAAEEAARRAAAEAAARAAAAAAARASADAAAQAAAKAAADAAKKVAAQSVPSVFNGTLRWPMPGTLTQEYGCTGVIYEPPLGSCAHFHNGIDVAASMYTPIRAAGAGRVVYAGANPYESAPAAWIVIIAHSSTLRTWYAHVDNSAHPPAVRTGDYVSAGQVVAYEGMTGHTTGPHLHWMVELEGEFVNPRMFL